MGTSGIASVGLKARVRDAQVQVVDELRPPVGRRDLPVELLREGEVGERGTLWARAAGPPLSNSQ